jgi:hypothetical protein
MERDTGRGMRIQTLHKVYIHTSPQTLNEQTEKQQDVHSYKSAKYREENK